MRPPSSFWFRPFLATASFPRAGFAWAEMLVVVGSIAVLGAILLPQCQIWREKARAAQCRGNLRAIGAALAAYHNSHMGLPPGYFPSDYSARSDGSAAWGHATPSYAWAAFILPQLGQEALHSELGVDRGELPQVIANPAKAPLLGKSLPVFRCPSDLAGDTMESAPLKDFQRALSRGPGIGGRVYGGSSSYVASGGYFELRHPLFISSPADFSESFLVKTGPNNGLFFVASHTHYREIIDGLSNTIALGERAWYQGSSTWVGTANVGGTGLGDAGTCLGRVYWRINEIPQSDASVASGETPMLATRENRLIITRPQTSRNGFGSYHSGGANFLMADGGTKFISDQIDFSNTIPVTGASPLEPIPNTDRLGLFQKLGIRNDSLRAADSLHGEGG